MSGQCDQPVFRFLGPGEGKGSLHVILCSSKPKGEDSAGTVTTWSLPEDGQPDEPGWTWNGPIADFTKFFKRV